MSTAHSPTPASASMNNNMEFTTHPRKSYRRKYRKIMVKFEERMQESNGLFRDEQRIFDISQRLAEQTDQILELLLEVNNTPQIPKSLRYSLLPAAALSAVETGHADSEQSVHEKLRVGRDRVQRGLDTLSEYETMQCELLNRPAFAPSNSYASLVRVARANPVTTENNGDASLPSGFGAMTIKQEEQYLQSLDAYLAGKSTNPRAHAVNSLGSRNAEKTSDREREMQLKNPVSVYNWLRKHQPQVFLQDHEAPGEKPGKPPGSRSSKRTTSTKDSKQENDLYDDDGIALDHGAGSRGKRKRDDDGAFRPKGGKSGHPMKRKREDLSGSGKKTKRSSMDARSF